MLPSVRSTPTMEDDARQLDTYYKKMQKLVAERKKRDQQLERRKRLLSEQDSSEDEQEKQQQAALEAEALEAAAAAAQQALDGSTTVQEDPEPPAEDETLLQPVAVSPSTSLDLTVVDWSALPAATVQPAEVYTCLLSQQLVVQLLGAGESVLRLLWSTILHGSWLQAPQATDQLLSYYATVPPNADPSWVPALADMLQALVQLGYRRAGAQAGASTGEQQPAVQVQGTPGAPAAQPMAVDEQAGAATPAPGNQREGEGPGLGSVQVVRLQQLLRCMAGLLSLHRQRPNGLVKLSRETREDGRSLLTALLELLICPAARSFLLLELSSALEALMLAWGCAGMDAHKSRRQPSSATQALVLACPGNAGAVAQQGGCVGPGAGVSGDQDWDWLCQQIASHVSTLGPSYRAGLAVITSLPGVNRRKSRLQQECALHLMRRLCGKAAPGPTAGTATGCLPTAALQLLTSVAQEAGRSKVDGLVEAIRKEPSAAAAGPGSSRGGPTHECDYHKVIAVLKCTKLVLWPALFTHAAAESEGASASARAAGRQFKEFLKGIKLVKGSKGTHHATEAALVALCKEYENSLEFAAGLSHDADS